MNVFFDLDGVLVDYVELHTSSFLEAWNKLNTSHPIDVCFHAIHLEARSTRQKLAILKEHFYEFDIKENEVSELKQRITQEKLKSARVYKKTCEAIAYLQRQGVKISVCSNSVRLTVMTSLEKITPIGTFELILSNESVLNPKPNPEIYLLALKSLNVKPEDVLVFEDSEVGKAAARAAGLRVIEVVDALDLSPRFLELALSGDLPCCAPVYNVVIPMAGLGSRFSAAGYKTPKPFLPIDGEPMYLKVIQNVVPAELMNRAVIHIIVREEHKHLFEMAEKPRNIKIHCVPALTEGAACTVLSIKSEINNEYPIVIANSDQYLEWSVDNFYRCLTHPDYDGVISTFYQPDPSDLRWSYANIDDEGTVTRVAEKQYIGDLATTGIYGWKRGADFVSDAEAMIRENIRVNKEFYVCPVYNSGIAVGRQFRTLNCKKMWGLGVPADYEHFLKHFKP
jgi:HAD superfamily hydrolase (TIGR01509 family)